MKKKRYKDKKYKQILIENKDRREIRWNRYLSRNIVYAMGKHTKIRTVKLNWNNWGRVLRLINDSPDIFSQKDERTIIANSEFSPIEIINADYGKRKPKRGPPRKVPITEYMAIGAMLKANFKVREIANRYNVTSRTIYHIQKKYLQEAKKL